MSKVLYRSQMNPVYTDLEFQVIDWTAYDAPDEDSESNSDEEEKLLNQRNKPWKYTIKAYGVDIDGHSVSVKIKNFKPYFFVKVPDKWTKSHASVFEKEIRSCVGQNSYQRRKHNASLHKCELVKRKDFYYFTNNKNFKFIKLTFLNKSAFYEYQKVFKSKLTLTDLKVKIDFSKQIYESSIDPLLRYFHELDIKPCSWVKINKRDCDKNIPAQTRCNIDITCNFDEVHPVDKTSIAPLLVASFDIECTSCDDSFPSAARESDKIIQIGTTFHKYGSKDCHIKHIITLKDCAKIDEDENIIQESYQTEKEVLIAWAELIAKSDPDIITGYNIWGFDFSYIFNRAMCVFKKGKGDYSATLLEILSRNLEKPAKFIEKKLSSAALGDNFLKYIQMEGVVQIDLLKLVQKDYNLDSYKLDAVANKFMGLNKVDLSPKQLFANYKEGTPDKIREIAVYCIKDCELVNHLIMKLEVVANNLGMGNVCLIPFSYLFLRGQGIKIFSLVAQKCRSENFLVIDLDKDNIDAASYEGAIVFPPKPGVYFEPIAVMDYASLYPSSMISENISHDSLVGYTEYDIEGNLLNDICNKEFDNLEDYNYNDIQYDVFKLVGEEGKEEKQKTGYKICRFAEKKSGEKAVLPRILTHLLKARKDTRKKMKYKQITLKSGELVSGLLSETADEYELFDIDENTTLKVDKSTVEDSQTAIKDRYNEFEQAILDGLQLAYKVTCNSLYGQVGASTSSICLKELAASTTATGRKMVEIARDVTLENFRGSKLVYGDTDSIFVDFTGYIKKQFGNDLTDKEMLQKTIDVGKEAGLCVTSKLKKPQDLEYEKVFWPFCIFSKKRYFGNKYEHDVDNYKQTSMGIVLKRRDNAPIVKDIYSGVIDIILNKKNIDAAIVYFKDEINKLMNGDVDIMKLVISKTIRAEYANPNQIAHKVLADRMGERDPGNKPCSNDRIPYCYIEEASLKCKICSKKVNPKQCKCIDCMELYCSNHLHNHRKECKIKCRFCKKPVSDCEIKKCMTCKGRYCDGCFKKHRIKKDKFGRESNDKCKKPLTTKILQGDILETPEYIKQNNIKIDYRYYLDHQIEKPVMQIFELVVPNSKSIIEDIIRKDTNKKKGTQEITKWFTTK